MYKIKCSQNGIGIKTVLYKKVLFMWLPDTVSTIKRGYEYMVDDQINEWVRAFNIPNENVFIPNNVRS